MGSPQYYLGAGPGLLEKAGNLYGGADGGRHGGKADDVVVIHTSCCLFWGDVKGIGIQHLWEQVIALTIYVVLIMIIAAQSFNQGLD